MKDLTQEEIQAYLDVIGIDPGRDLNSSVYYNRYNFQDKHGYNHLTLSETRHLKVYFYYDKDYVYCFYHCFDSSSMTNEFFYNIVSRNLNSFHEIDRIAFNMLLP